MPHHVRLLRSVLLLGSALGLSVRAAGPIPPFPPQAILPAAAGEQPARPWPADAFLPLSESRIAALPASEQGPWKAYWAETVRRTKLLPPRDLVDHSATKPLPGGPIGSSYSKGVRLGAPPEYYASDTARTTADHVVSWQTAVGAWVKSGDYSRDRRPEDDHHDAWSGGTFDNDSTIYELRFLALVTQASGDTPRAKVWRDCFDRGLDYVLAAQYPNGGFPQIYPLVGWYHDAITFNDDAMVHILALLRDVSDRKGEFSFVSADQAKAAAAAVQRGIGCVLKTQLRTTAGTLAVWAQQYDPLTLQPCAARNFEPIAACSNESIGLTEYLMSLSNPTAAVIDAVEGSIAWYRATAYHGVVWDRRSKTGTGLVARPDAPDLWARFYELDTAKPIFGERDRMVHYAVTELSDERRLGYGWFNTSASRLPAKYQKWKEQNVSGK